MSAPAATGVIALTRAQASTVLAALEEAAEARRGPSVFACLDCAARQDRRCPDHQGDQDRASEYDTLAGLLADALDAPPCGQHHDQEDKQ